MTRKRIWGLVALIQSVILIAALCKVSPQTLDAFAYMVVFLLTVVPIVALAGKSPR